MVGPFSISAQGQVVGQVTFLLPADVEVRPCPALVDWCEGAERYVVNGWRTAGARHVVYPAYPTEPSPDMLAEAQRLEESGVGVQQLVSMRIDTTGVICIVTPEQAERLRRGDAIFAFPGEPNPLWPR